MIGRKESSNSYTSGLVFRFFKAVASPFTACFQDEQRLLDANVLKVLEFKFDETVFDLPSPLSDSEEESTSQYKNSKKSSPINHPR